MNLYSLPIIIITKSNNLQRIENDKEDEYFKSLCKQLLIKGILSNNINVAAVEMTLKKTKLLKKKFHCSVKVRIIQIYFIGST